MSELNAKNLVENPLYIARFLDNAANTGLTTKTNRCGAAGQRTFLRPVFGSLTCRDAHIARCDKLSAGLAHLPHRGLAAEPGYTLEVFA